MIPRKASIALGVAVAATAIAPAAADAAFISKREARSYAVKTIRGMYYDIPSASGYWVEHSPRCERITRGIVECDYEMKFDSDVYCSDAVQIIATRRHYRARFPYEADCA